MAIRLGTGRRRRAGRRRSGPEEYLWDYVSPAPGGGKSIPFTSQRIIEVFNGVLDQYEQPRRHALHVEFYPYTSLKHTIRLVDGHYVLRISDLMIGSPPEALEAIAHIMFAKITGRGVLGPFEEVYNRYADSAEAARKMERTARERGRRLITGSSGEVRDLEASFERVNERYFGGKAERPEITWSRYRSRSELGHYDEVFNVLTISRRLDSRHVPLYVLDYVMYHEMLHMVYPARVRDGRRVYHTREFLDAEKQFEHYARVMRWLKRN